MIDRKIRLAKTPYVPIRSRNGCITCKIRKVKCGEEKPSCIRCSSTGRKCEYTSPVPSRHASTSANASSVVSVLDRPLSVSPSGVWLERWAFTHYSQHAASFIAGGVLDIDFWSGVVPQVCRSEPAVWDAINAMGALFENPDPCFDPVWLRQNRSQGLRPSHSDALRWYSRSLATMRRQIDRGTVDMNVALISCILFICIETLQGRVEEALRLYQQGVSLIFELRAGGTRMGTNSTLLEDTIFPIFLRLGTIALSISGVPVSGLLDEMQGRTHTTNKFSSLSSARLAMTALAAEGMIFQRTVEEHFATKGHECPLPLAFKRKQEDIQRRLAEWHRAYTNLVNSDPSELPSSVTSLLLSFHAATSIITAVSTEQLETAYDAYLPQFRLIVEHSTVHLEASADPDGRQPPFTFEMGPGLSLFLTAIKCRDPWLRRRALELLRKAPPMQALYKCPPGAILAEAFMKLEELGTIFNGSSPGSAGPYVESESGRSEIESTIPITTLIPEESRIHGYCVFRPRDDPWPLGDLDISKWNRGPDQIYLKFSRNRIDEKTNTWRMVHDIVPIDY